MKTTAEEKLLRNLERVINDAAKNMTRAEFKSATKSAHETAKHVIFNHRQMIELWTAMDRRIMARARLHLGKPQTGDHQ